MHILTFFYPWRSAGRMTKHPSADRLHRYLGCRHLTDAECNNLRDYYRRNDVQSPAIMTAALGGHPFSPTRRR
jgi:hypothetical protein